MNRKHYEEKVSATDGAGINYLANLRFEDGSSFTREGLSFFPQFFPHRSEGSRKCDLDEVGERSSTSLVCSSLDLGDELENAKSLAARPCR